MSRKEERNLTFLKMIFRENISNRFNRPNFQIFKMLDKNLIKATLKIRSEILFRAISYVHQIQINIIFVMQMNTCVNRVKLFIVLRNG